MTSQEFSHEQLRLSKHESSEDIGRTELEEGKTASVSGLQIKSSNIHKMPMDFGNSSSLDKVWLSSKFNEKKEVSTKLVEAFQLKEILVQQVLLFFYLSRLLTNGEESSFLTVYQILIILLSVERGKVFNWDIKGYITNQEELKDPEMVEQVKQIDGIVDGKSLKNLNIKNIHATSSCLLMTTETGEVIVSKLKDKSLEEEKEKNIVNQLFRKKAFKVTQNISFEFSKLSSIQSHFISQIACGQNHAILLTSSGFVYSFGKNSFGQLGHQQDSNAQNSLEDPTIIFQLLNLKVFSIACGKNHNIVVGTARDTITQTFQIYSSENALFTTIDKNKTLVYSWGNNIKGQLGLNDSNDRSAPTLIEGLLDYNFKKASSGYYHSALLEENGQLFIFGSNEFGQIGNDSEESQITPLSLFYNETEGICQCYISDIICFRNSSIVISEDNDIYQWGVNVYEKKNEEGKRGFFTIPVMIQKPEELLDEPIQIVEKIFGFQEFGTLIMTRPRIEKEELSSTGRESNDQSMSMAQEFRIRGDSSTLGSEKTSFWQQHPQFQNADQIIRQNLGGGGGGISFSKEFENLLQYIAITAGNTNMPAGVAPMTFRPSNLPPKDPNEERLHKRLVDEHRKLYVKKIRERERHNEKKKIQQEQKEKRLHEMKAIWEKEIFPNWDMLKRTKRVRELWIEGLPPVIRGKVWFYAFGNRSSISNELYTVMAERGCKLRKLLKDLSAADQEIIENGGQSRKLFAQFGKENEIDGNTQKSEIEILRNESEGSLKNKAKLEELNHNFMKIKNQLSLLISVEGGISREKSISIIETDIPRTFPMLGFFKVGGLYYDNLQRILEAFTMQRPDIGYVQGMSYLAATLLLYMDEKSAFITFCNLITKFPIMPFYLFNETQVKKVLQLFKQVFQHNLPDLCEHFEMENIQPKQYIYEWFMTLFTKCLNLSLVSRVWDFYFLDGIFVLYQTAIAILRIVERQMLEVDFEGLMKIFSQIPDLVTDEDLLVQYIYDVSFPKWVYDEIPKLESEFLKQIQLMEENN